jgi:hypothetical protein
MSGELHKCDACNLPQTEVAEAIPHPSSFVIIAQKQPGFISSPPESAQRVSFILAQRVNFILFPNTPRDLALPESFHPCKNSTLPKTFPDKSLSKP